MSSSLKYLLQSWVKDPLKTMPKISNDLYENLPRTQKWTVNIGNDDKDDADCPSEVSKSASQTKIQSLNQYDLIQITQSKEIMLNQNTTSTTRWLLDSMDNLSWESIYFIFIQREAPKFSLPYDGWLLNSELSFACVKTSCQIFILDCHVMHK